MVPKVIAYADDLALLTSNTDSITKCIAAYDEFSKCSGLFLNADKTEIICLHRFTPNSHIDIVSNDEVIKINLLEKIIICGRTFSVNNEIEVADNVTSKINKLIQALSSWSKRPLSIFGRCLVLKTFGLSQLIYSMQNSFFEVNHLKSVEKICFNFLWNKKGDKSRAFERISRNKLKLPTQSGRINAPDIFSLDLALKYKQLVRSTDIECNHAIRHIQIELVGYIPDRIFQKNMPCSFINKGCEASGILGGFMIDEILKSNEESRLHRIYYDLIASENPYQVANIVGTNSITKQQINVMCNKFGFRSIGQLINEYKFPSTDLYRTEFQNFMQIPIFASLLNRKSISYDHSFRDGMILGANQITKSKDMLTKTIKTRILLGTNEVTYIKEFRDTKKILHPKERETVFFKLHRVILSNDKLFKMKLIPSNICMVCDNVQDQLHILNACPNATSANEVLARLNITSNPHLLINLEALRDRYLLINKNKTITSEMWDIIFSNRINDFDRINENKIVTKRLKDIIKVAQQ